MALDYFYDEQIRRYLLQFTRIFSGFQYQTGIGSSGTTVLRTVPCTLASANRQIGHINRNNSENTILSTPSISCWIKGMDRVDDRRQAPNYVRHANVYERDVDPDTNAYTDQPGKMYTVESIMPVPYELTMQVDIWTSNEMQKQQLLEQILVLFNPAIDLQTGTNPIDWTSITYVELTSIEWSNKSFPIGADDEIEMASLSFKVPIWISAPSKLKKQNIIQQIVLNILELDKSKAEFTDYEWSSSDLLSRMIITPGDHRIYVAGQEITLLSGSGTTKNADDSPVEWAQLLRQYGKFRNGVSQIRLRPVANIEDSSQDIVGTLNIHPEDPSKLLWTLDIDSLRANTLAAVARIVDPAKSYPGQRLPVPAIGQRYLIIDNEIKPGGEAWGNVTADPNDIIEYTGNGWIVSFDASTHIDPEYVLNLTTNQQFFWTGGMWQHSVEAEYNAGYWRLYL